MSNCNGVISRTSFALPPAFATKDVAQQLAEVFAPVKGTCLLYSGGDGDAAQRSILFLLPYDQIIVRGATTVHCHPDGTILQQSCDSNPWDSLKNLMGPLDGGSQPEWVGYLGYEMGATADATVRSRYFAGKHPDALFQRCAVCVIFDYPAGTATVTITTPLAGSLGAEQMVMLESLRTVEGWLEALQDSSELNAIDGSLSLKRPLEQVSSYCQKVHAVQELIHSGDVYQVNVSQRCVVQGDANPYQIFSKLVDVNPAPFAAFLNLGEQMIVSSSPERFLCRQGNVLEARPIKGTIARGLSSEHDVIQRESLLASEKDRAELLMITDLMRNDLGKVSEIGSVEVPELIRCEAYTNVFHLLSIVTSRVVADLHSIDIIRACFPAGSITGCPKLRAMEVIADIEKRRRGIYTGSIGYLCGNGDFDFNVAIRTLSCDASSIEVQIGGAIVADSDAPAEYDETLAKGESIFSVLGVCGGNGSCAGE
ncbi:hypothetical protein SCG7086_AL_00210 [Chlamydiales bacterium SCGC AG-110-P3]|nr:hypothetical protein SCG7086_AL_00210 [Chlamydiales bacterium SCGC AG-110-P3]